MAGLLEKNSAPEKETDVMAWAYEYAESDGGGSSGGRIIA